MLLKMRIFVSFTSNLSLSQFNQFIYLNVAHLVLHMYDFIIIKLNSKNTQLDRLHWIFNVFHEETSNYVEVRNNGGMEEKELEVDPPRRSSDHHRLLAFFVTCVPADPLFLSPFLNKQKNVVVFVIVCWQMLILLLLQLIRPSLHLLVFCFWPVSPPAAGLLSRGQNSAFFV